MEFKEQIKQLADTVRKLKGNIRTEEATKTAMILPFLQALGYNVFDPTEVVPEFTCDVGTKKGEKVDYAIMMNGKPAILIECKHYDKDLSLHDNQLLRYFNVANARFGILTNGIEYRFYTDLNAANKMDKDPFFQFDLFNFRDNQIAELSKFHKANFDVGNIFDTANDMKLASDIKSIITEEFNEPSVEFVKFILKKNKEKIVVTQRMIDYVQPFVKQSIAQYVNDIVEKTLSTAIKTRQEEEPQSIQGNNEKLGIVTTEEELEGFAIIKAILYPIVALLPGGF